MWRDIQRFCVFSSQSKASNPSANRFFSDDDQEWVVWFMMPSRYTLDTLPTPSDSRIRLREAPAHTAAVLSFSGRVRPQTFEARAAELSAALEGAGLTPTGPPTLAQYSDPRAPGPLRHNEIHIPLQ